MKPIHNQPNPSNESNRFHPCVSFCVKQLPPGALDEAMALAARGRSWSRAMQLLRLPHVEPTVEHYQLAIAACRHADHKWRQALELLDEAQAKGLKPPPETFVEVSIVFVSCSCVWKGRWGGGGCVCVCTHAAVRKKTRGGWCMCLCVCLCMHAAASRPFINPPSLFLPNQVMRICAASQRHKEAVAVLDRMAKARKVLVVWRSHTLSLPLSLPMIGLLVDDASIP